VAYSFIGACDDNIDFVHIIVDWRDGVLFD